MTNIRACGADIRHYSFINQITIRNGNDFVNIIQKELLRLATVNQLIGLLNLGRDTHRNPG